MLQRCTSNSTTPFSILFPSSSMEEAAATNYSSVVDCTLSLGTPSTRHSTAASASVQRSSCSSTTTPSFCWDIINQSSKTQQTSSSSSSSSSNLGGSDPLLLARRCANCDTTSTPLWRNGPRGPKSLCNACGIRYKKEERRAAASPAANLNDEYQRQQQQYPWSCYGTSPSKTVTTSSSWCQSDEDMADQVPYLSWRVNVVPPQFPVTDRPRLFQYQ